MTLDTLAALQAEHPRFDHRFTIEHYCISNTTQARRLAALGGYLRESQPGHEGLDLLGVLAWEQAMAEPPMAMADA